MTTSLFDYEAAYLRAGLEQLKAYLLADELYWNLGLRQERGRAPYPQMTLGNLLLAKARAAGAAQGAEEQRELAAMSKELEAMLGEWRSAAEAKAEQEFGVRLRQWGRSMLDFGEAPSRHAASYASEVRVRAELALLAGYLPRAAKEPRGELAEWDTRLRRLSTAGDFVWEQELEGAFPKGAWWYLWVTLKA